MSGENYRSSTKSHDPGWNDPPKLSYSPGTGPGQSSKLNLNKRVAFPLAKQPGNDGKSPAQSIPASSLPPASHQSETPPLLPPMTIGTPSRPDQSSQVNTDRAAGGDNCFPENTEMQTFVKDTLEKCVEQLDQATQPEIRKRLELIQLSWNEGKLGDEPTRKLYRLAKALSEANATVASEIHRSIIVDHGSLCVQWAPALRRLVMALGK